MTTVVLNNRYRVIRELGKGGFGETFLAVDTHLPSEQTCVIKQLYPIVSKPKQYQWVRERFQREAAILEALSQGNSQIPRLYAYFAEAETFYLVQEYIEGVTLTEKVEQTGVLSEREVTKIVISLLQVLDYVHSQRIIHRDVKPDNVILRAGDGLPVLIDFGVVKEALETVMDSDRTDSIAIGTPGYMPSEQAAGRPVYSSDLYSLGLTAIFLLSGKPPQMIESDPNTGELLWRKILPHLHGQLAGVIDRAIRFHPRDRFANAKEMLSALRNHTSTRLQEPTSETMGVSPGMTSGATVAAVSPSASEREKKGNGLWIGGAIAIVIAFSIGVVGYGMIQVLQSLRTRSDNNVVVTEPTPSPLPPPLPPKEPEPPKPQKPTPPQPQPQPEEPTLNLDLNTPTVVVPTIPIETPPSQPTVSSVSVFSTGVEGTKVIEELGEPTAISRGYWENTQSILYKNYIPGKLDLGFIVDRDTAKIRQTEATFADSVELSLMESKLQAMLQGQLNSTIEEALAQVYRQETDLRSFSVGNLQGIIQRQQGGNIYVGVWEKDLH